MDPFLMLDDFRSDDPEKYLAGFPWHPHRGIETVTYMMDGLIEHGDSMDNSGIIGPGDVQWMTAGSGIVHQEMPRAGKDGRKMGGFQLWVNLPKHSKMMGPRYQEVKASTIPEVDPAKGVKVRVIAGAVCGTLGPVTGILAEPLYFDVSLGSKRSFEIPVTEGHTVLVYVFEGEAYFGPEREKDMQAVAAGSVAVMTGGDIVEAHTKGKPSRFLFLSGKPLNEPVAWWGPIVMNTEEELELAFEEYRKGTFIKMKK